MKPNTSKTTNEFFNFNSDKPTEFFNCRVINHTLPKRMPTVMERLTSIGVKLYFIIACFGGFYFGVATISSLVFSSSPWSKEAIILQLIIVIKLTALFAIALVREGNKR